MSKRVSCWAVCIVSLTEKQQEYLDHCNRRWGIKIGATGSGKSFVDYAVVIPKRILACKNEGHVVLMGNTRGTLDRNILDPMREIWPNTVGQIKADNTIELFGRKAYALGADSKKHIARIQGATIEYAYGDELTTWEPGVFEMLKSRLRCKHSHFDGTGNPSFPEHWLKKFIDDPELQCDIFQQSYTIDDNPMLPPEVVASLKREYTGVYYERYIMGRWVAAEGTIFPIFASNPERFSILNDTADKQPYTKKVIGIDFGGNGAKTAMALTGYQKYDSLTVLMESGLPITQTIDAAAICDSFVAFYRDVIRRYGSVDWILCDSASPTMINSLVSAARNAGLPWRNIRGCRKNEVSQRPRTVDRLLMTGRLRIADRCTELRRAMSNLRWDEKHPDIPEDKNLGNINDWWDAFCYTWLDFVEFIDRR